MLLITITSSGMAETLKEVMPGQVSLDLGDGYKAAFELPSAEAGYDIETATTVSDIVKFTRYEIYVYPTGKEDTIANIYIMVYSDPQLFPLPKYSRTEPTNSDIGPRVQEPKTIDDARGEVGYDWPAGNSGSDFSEAMWEFFSYYPGAWEEDGSLKGTVEIKGESGEMKTYSTSLEVIRVIIDSIHVTGPGI